MDRHWLTQRFQSWGDRPALIWRNESWSFTQLCEGCEDWLGELQQHGVKPGDTLAVCGDYSPKLCALLLAALLNRNITIPLTSRPPLAGINYWSRRRPGSPFASTATMRGTSPASTAACAIPCCGSSSDATHLVWFCSAR